MTQYDLNVTLSFCPRYPSQLRCHVTEYRNTVTNSVKTEMHFLLRIYYHRDCSIRREVKHGSAFSSIFHKYQRSTSGFNDPLVSPTMMIRSIH